MKKTFKKIMSVTLALISCFMLCSIAFANEAEPSSDSVYLVDAKIIYVPLKNRIVFSFGSPALPDGIVVKLTYNDGTVKTATIKGSDDGYFANKERVTGSVRAAVVEYGILTDFLFFNDGQIKIEYKYLCLPTISGLFHMLYELL